MEKNILDYNEKNDEKLSSKDYLKFLIPSLIGYFVSISDY